MSAAHGEGVVIVTVMVATFELSKLSFALNVNVSVPLDPALAVYVYAPLAVSVITAVPFFPLSTMLYVSASPSGSVATSVPLTEPPEGTDCLLYTSDAADERSSVDLGGRRIIKKK